jgi:N-glycosylase/DNA lyase
MMLKRTASREFPVQNYDLDATLDCGQAFRWKKHHDWWTGIIGDKAVRLRAETGQVVAETNTPVAEWSWLIDYLQLDAEFPAILDSFPKDAAMREALHHCRGLRLLRQNPWECLASFILSSTKQIVQIRQIVENLCQKFGEKIPAPAGFRDSFSFPSPERLSQAAESELRACKMGFRAPYLLETASIIARQELVLSNLYDLPLESARNELMRLPGVGRKIADCVLLFAFGFQSVFPVDVWITKALRQLYFPNRRPNPERLRHFASHYFGPFSGYAQQYLFHYMRTKAVLNNLPNPKDRPSFARGDGVAEFNHQCSQRP